jgi:hypothetical protein
MSELDDLEDAVLNIRPDGPTTAQGAAGKRNGTKAMKALWLTRGQSTIAIPLSAYQPSLKKLKFMGEV